MVSKASRRVSVGFTTPMDSRIQDSCTTGLQRHPLNRTPLTKLPLPWCNRGRSSRRLRTTKAKIPNHRIMLTSHRLGWCVRSGIVRRRIETRLRRGDQVQTVRHSCATRVAINTAKTKLVCESSVTRVGMRCSRSNRRGHLNHTVKHRCHHHHHSSRKRARKESSHIVVQGTKGKSPWPKEASMELEKCVKASLDAGIPLRGKGGAFENGCKIHMRLGFKMHRKKDEIDWLYVQREPR